LNIVWGIDLPDPQSLHPDDTLDMRHIVAVGRDDCVNSAFTCSDLCDSGRLKYAGKSRGLFEPEYNVTRASGRSKKNTQGNNNALSMTFDFAKNILGA